MFGDSITTDHISPAGNIAAASPAGKWLIAQGVPTKDFNSYGARRGNHEVMMRGTFANIRLRNELAGGKEGWWTATEPGAEPRPIYDVAMEHQQRGTPLVIIAGKEYGTGSSRDWAAKGTALVRRAGGDRGVVRAHSPVEPRGHGRAAAGIHERRNAAVVRADRFRDVRDLGPR